MLLVKAARLVGRLPFGECFPGETDRTTMPDPTQLPIPNQLIDMSTRILEQTCHLLDRQEAGLGCGGCRIVARVRAQRHEPKPRTGVLERWQDPRDVRALPLLPHLVQILEEAIDVRHGRDSTG